MFTFVSYSLRTIDNINKHFYDVFRERSWYRKDTLPKVDFCLVIKRFFPSLIPVVVLFCHSRYVSSKLRSWLSGFDNSALGKAAQEASDESWWATGYPQCSSVTPKKELFEKGARILNGGTPGTVIRHTEVNQDKNRHQCWNNYYAY